MDSLGAIETNNGQRSSRTSLGTSHQQLHLEGPGATGCKVHNGTLLQLFYDNNNNKRNNASEYYRIYGHVTNSTYIVTGTRQTLANFLLTHHQ